MIVSSCTPQNKNVKGIYDILVKMKEAGFKAYDFSMNNYQNATDAFVDKKDFLKRAKNLRKFADELGLECNQTHSNFPVERPNFTQEKIDKEFKILIRCLKVSKILGAKYCVVHPLNDYSDEYNAEYFKKILVYAHKIGMKIALENMWNWDYEKNQNSTASCSNHENYVHLLDLINDDYAVALLDIGHAELRGLETSAVKLINALGSRLKCLHIHDNDTYHDLHQVPGMGVINFEEVIDALAKINYQGDITMEVLHPLTEVEESQVVNEYRKIYLAAENIMNKLQKKQSI